MINLQTTLAAPGGFNSSVKRINAIIAYVHDGLIPVFQGEYTYLSSNRFGTDLTFENSLASRTPEIARLRDKDQKLWAGF
jgi:hypothetical protein